MKVLAAMSGGVDSAVAAARAVDAGHDVTGVHLALARHRGPARSDARGCCTPEDSRDARRAADAVGIPFYVWDLSERFHTDVVDDFFAEYAAGRTPNPCLRCNEKIKFAAVLDRALALGFDAIVTGHYARISPEGVLRRAVDPAKDQSYVLAGLTRSQLTRTILPLGGSTKTEVRAEAARRSLAVASKPDSTDICFITDGDTRGFLSERLGTPTGDIVDGISGAVLGHHRGAYAYTIGQRRGLDLRVAAADQRPRYVTAVVPETNTVVVGPIEALDVTELHGARTVWTGAHPTTAACVVQVRAHGETLPAVVTPTDDAGLLVTLTVPARGVAAGQAVVAYADDIVLCSATITGTASATVAGVTTITGTISETAGTPDCEPRQPVV